MSMEALQASIEQRLQQISAEVERVRAALDALGPSEPARAARETRSTIAQPLPKLDGHGHGHGPVAADTQSEPPAGEPADTARAGASDGDAGLPVTGHDRAVQSLRRELAAGLRNGRP
jgi:hypothetical protein